RQALYPLERSPARLPHVGEPIERSNVRSFLCLRADWSSTMSMTVEIIRNGAVMVIPCTKAMYCGAVIRESLAAYAADGHDHDEHPAYGSGMALSGVHPAFSIGGYPKLWKYDG